MVVDDAVTFWYFAYLTFSLTFNNYTLRDVQLIPLGRAVICHSEATPKNLVVEHARGRLILSS